MHPQNKQERMQISNKKARKRVRRRLFENENHFEENLQRHRNTVETVPELKRVNIRI